MAAQQQRRPIPPYRTEHAEDRFNDRAQHDHTTETDLWTAWIDAEPVDLPRPWSLAGDEARFHRGSVVVLCRRDTSITTVYDLVGPDAHPHVREAVENQFDIAIKGL